MTARALFFSVLTLPAGAQIDPGRELNKALADKTGKKLQITAEAKQRAEQRTAQFFGRDRDLAADFIRLRIGLIYRPTTWIKLVGVAQDARSAFYGLPPPGSVRDPHDLQEGYAEFLRPDQRGFGATIGRQMIGYGDTRLIGSPQWAYTARTWDTARVYYLTKKARFEALHISPIVPRGTGFNRPILGDRIWGTYNTFKDVLGATVIDLYVLRHDQNRPSGFTGAGRLAIQLYGSRMGVPLSKSFRFTAENVIQRGHVGPLPHSAFGWVGQLGYKRTLFGKPVDFANEYKFASGTNPASGKSGTFDQLYPAAHDKLGHMDVIGWRNVHNVRSITTLSSSKTWQWILMYNNTWLADPRDALYNAQGRVIVRSPSGTAGRHAGHEIDLYTNYQWNSYTISAGIGKFFPGEFVRNTTPGARSRLIYLSTSYSF
ncbi:MAG: hypothetical protein FJW39_07595 [Acidobacteria bacterium]|nr:hypothetical protein [Acidobacteriota bacterium]